MEVESQSVPQWYLPGQLITDSKAQFNSSNLFQNRNNHIATLKYGELAKKEKKVQNKDTIQFLDLMTFTYAYEPVKGDLVIGTVKIKSADYYILDIGAPLDGTLGALQFDNATKKNKPNIQQGTLVYCRVTEYSKYLGARLSCFNKGFNSKNDLGELKGGIKIEAPRYKHQLVEKKLQLMAKYLKFQIAFGKNGIIWVKSSSLASVVVLYNVINQILLGSEEGLIIKILESSKG